jgi:hypothetical protein
MEFFESSNLRLCGEANTVRIEDSRNINGGHGWRDRVRTQDHNLECKALYSQNRNRGANMINLQNFRDH